LRGVDVYRSATTTKVNVAVPGQPIVVPFVLSGDLIVTTSPRFYVIYQNVSLIGYVASLGSLYGQTTCQILKNGVVWVEFVVWDPVLVPLNIPLVPEDYLQVAVLAVGQSEGTAANLDVELVLGSPSGELTVPPTPVWGA